MKKYIYLLFISFSFILQSCEEVIDLDIDQYEKRLVIDANIFADESTNNKIRLFYSAPFYADRYEYISDAIVTITDKSTNTLYTFNYSNDGWYENSAFDPIVETEYTLNVTINDKIYEATTIVTIAPEIEKVEQFDNAGFTGDQYEIRFYFYDNEETEDYYLINVTDGENGEYAFSSDQLRNGNLMYDLNFVDKDSKGKTLYFALASISKDYYNYLNKLTTNAATQGNPFATPSGALKGNIINLSNKNEYPLGYFHIAKRSKAEHTIK